MNSSIKINKGQLTGVVNSVVAGTNVTVDNTDPKNPIISSSGGGGGAGINVIRGSNNNMTITATESVASGFNNAGGANWVFPTVPVTKSGSLITGPAIEIQSERVAATSTISSIELKYFQEDGSGGIIFRLYAFKINDNGNTIYDVRLLFEKTVTTNLYRIGNKTFLPVDINDVNMIAGEQICFTVQLSSATPARAKGFNILIKY